MEKDRCSCGWIGDAFNKHYQETRFDDQIHIEQDPVKVDESRAA